MKKEILLVLIVLLASCKGTSEYTITGTVADDALNGNYAYLCAYGHYRSNETATVYDSTLIENGGFTFHGIIENPELRTVRLSPEVSYLKAPFFCEKGNITITIDNQSTIGGTPANDELQKFQVQYMDKRIALNSAWEEINKASTEEEKQATTAKKDEVLNDFYALIGDYVLANSNNLKGAYVFIERFYELSEDDKIRIYSQAGDVFKSVDGMDDIGTQIEIMKRLAIGQPFIDFELPDPDGNLHKLSEYVEKNNVVMVDFWASWCGPCIGEIPNMKAAYDKYKSKGFEIVGVSLDDSKEHWTEAIEKYELPWPHLSDVKGWQCEAAQLYGIRFIPQIYLLDKDGIIIDKHLRGEALEKKLAEVLKE